MIVYVNDYDVGIEALPTPIITLLLLLQQQQLLLLLLQLSQNHWQTVGMYSQDEVTEVVYTITACTVHFEVSPSARTPSFVAN